MKVAVIGAGSWGTAVAGLVSADEVQLWSRRTEVAEAINTTRHNPDYLVDYELPPKVTATADLEQALTGAELLVWGVPSHGFRAVLEQSADLIFIVDSYHEFSHPREMGEAIFKALKPGGHLIVVEDRAEDVPRSSGRLHNMTEKQARKEITALGFRWLRNETFLPQQHFLVCQRPTAP